MSHSAFEMRLVLIVQRLRLRSLPNQTHGLIFLTEKPRSHLTLGHVMPTAQYYILRMVANTQVYLSVRVPRQTLFQTPVPAHLVSVQNPEFILQLC